MKRMFFNWSTGKDAALSLYKLQKGNEFHVDHLLVSVNEDTDRVSMHGLGRDLMIAQIASIGINYSTVELPAEPSMEEYSKLMSEAVTAMKNKGFHDTGFGDIFLEDLREYRESQLKALNIKCHFPLWKKNTNKLIEEFIDLGFKAIVVSINSTKLDKSFCGREINREFVKDLPETIDPCGEYGEFHTFCYDGPIFQMPVKFNRSKQVFKSYERPNSEKETDKDTRIGFWFQDLVLEE